MEKLLVRLVNYKTNKLYACFYTTNWSEVFKMYHFIWKLDSPIDITTFIDNDNCDYNDSIFHIEDIKIQFGSEDALNVLDILVEEFPSI